MSDESFITEFPPTPESPFVLVGQLLAHPEHADALERVYGEMTRQAASEPGILFYYLARDEHDRNRFYFFEQYAGRQAFEEHSKQPIIQKLATEYKYIRGIKEARIARVIKPAEAKA
ncbi:ABM domain-containing protein [Mycena chlorophos]|uniref:ABM domain-containing protein n=1 Tax=Mycena chlorophos TaxID=658473 RepID=A0A8H6WBD1_MYCCL|nr:ABM domain-containing protein [Mycena chlorophos]